MKISIAELLSRVQRLAETPRPPDGFPPEWQVAAFFLGDAAAIGAAAIRAADD